MNLSCWLTEWWEKEMEQKPLSDVELRCVCVCVCVCATVCMFSQEVQSEVAAAWQILRKLGIAAIKKMLTKHHSIHNLSVQNFVATVGRLIELPCTGCDRVIPVSLQFQLGLDGPSLTRSSSFIGAGVCPLVQPDVDLTAPRRAECERQ